MIFALLCCIAPLVVANASESAEPLLFGMSSALTGPAADLGINMDLGVRAAFEEQNRTGGIQGRPIKLVTLDDGYEPERTAPNMHTLINEKGVLAIVGNVGTPTAVAAVPIANKANVPFFGAFTGAGVLRKTPPDRCVINYRASYAEETSAMVNALINIGKIMPREIAFFTQRDAYGDAGFAGGLSALKAHGLSGASEIAHGRYERNTLAIENGLADILFNEIRPRAIIMVGAYAPCAEFIKIARSVGLDALFLNVSFVGAEPLRKALGDSGEGVIVTQVVPHFQEEIPAVRAYRDALETLSPGTQPSFGSLEGYIAARILCRALLAIDREITRNAIIEALEGLGEFDIGLDVPLELGPEDHQACHRVWPTMIHGGAVIPIEWDTLARSPGAR